MKNTKFLGFFILFVACIHLSAGCNRSTPVSLTVATNTSMALNSHLPSPLITLESTVTPPEPHIPAHIWTQIESDPGPEPYATVRHLTFTDNLDAQSYPGKLEIILTNPVRQVYAVFQYDHFYSGIQWTALWYRENELIFYETKKWDQSAGGLGFSDWQPAPGKSLPGRYEVQIFVGSSLKARGNFILEGEPLLVTKSTINLSTPTWTPVPTLSNAERKQHIRDLTRLTPNCRFPCWWGIRPGETSWPEASQFLASFMSVNPTQWYLENEYPIPMYYYRVADPVGEDSGVGMDFAISGDKILVINIGLANELFNLDQILQVFGKPDQVFIQSSSVSNGDFTLFGTIVVYSQQRFLAEYYTFDQRSGNRILACPPFKDPQLSLWSEAIEWTDPLISDDVMGTDPIFQPKPIEQVTNMNIDKFYKEFRDSDSQACIETFTEKWP